MAEAPAKPAAPDEGVELFHRISEPESAEVRRRVTDLGLLAQISFRNVDFEVHRQALAARGGSATPALWDGALLHAGKEGALAALARLAQER